MKKRKKKMICSLHKIFFFRIFKNAVVKRGGIKSLSTTLVFISISFCINEVWMHSDVPVSTQAHLTLSDVYVRVYQVHLNAA